MHDIRDLVRRNLPALAETCDHLEPHQCLYDLTAARTKLNFTDRLCTFSLKTGSDIVQDVTLHNISKGCHLKLH